MDTSLNSLRTISGRYVALRPINRPDFPKLYEWRSDLAALPSWTTLFRRVVRFEEFVQETDAWLRDAIAMMATDIETGQAVGFARAYHLNLVDGWVYVQGFADQAYRMRRHVAEATALFGAYLFNQFPLRKICSEVFEFNEQAVRLNGKLGFRETGRMRRHVWYQDRYWDLLLFEMFREDWDEAMRRFSFITSVEAEAEQQIAGVTTDGRG
jgi:RimJ/RimL family protein N-acetyltransferase